MIDVDNLDKKKGADYLSSDGNGHANQTSL